jgi:hypothetical protein
MTAMEVFNLAASHFRQTTDLLTICCQTAVIVPVSSFCLYDCYLSKLFASGHVERPERLVITILVWIAGIVVCPVCCILVAELYLLGI